MIKSNTPVNYFTITYFHPVNDETKFILTNENEMESFQITPHEK